MSPVDPNDISEMAKNVAKSRLREHFEILIRSGVIAITAGFVGGTVAFLLSGERRISMTKKQLVFYYLFKVSMGFFAAYLAILAIPILGLSVSPETEQVVSLLAAILGSDFIAYLTQRIFGEHFKACEDTTLLKEKKEKWKNTK